MDKFKRYFVFIISFSLLTHSAVYAFGSTFLVPPAARDTHGLIDEIERKLISEEKKPASKTSSKRDMTRRRFLNAAAAMIVFPSISSGKEPLVPRKGKEYFEMLISIFQNERETAVKELKAIFEQGGNAEVKYKVIVDLINNGLGTSNIRFSIHAINAIDRDLIQILTNLVFDPTVNDELKGKILQLLKELGYKGSKQAGQSLADIVCNKKIKSRFRLSAFFKLNNLANNKVQGASIQANIMPVILPVLKKEFFPLLKKCLLDPEINNRTKRLYIQLMIEYGGRVFKEAAINLASIGADSDIDPRIRSFALSKLRDLIKQGKSWAFNDLEKTMSLFEKIAAEDTLEENVDLMKYRYEILEYVNEILQYLILEGPETVLASLTTKRIYKQRGEKNVLSHTKGRKGVILVVMDPDIQDEFSHGGKIAAVINKTLGDEYIKIEKIHVKDNEVITPEAENELRRISKENPDKTIVANISLGWKGNTNWIKGILDPKLAEELGENTVFVFSGGNKNTIYPQTPPSFDNVLYIGGVLKNRNNKWTRWTVFKDLGTSIGPGIFGLSSVETINKREWGTSFAGPRVVALLSLILKQNPDRPVPDCIEWLRKQAIPLKGDRLFTLGMLGAGVFDPQKINTRIEKSWKPPKKKTPQKKEISSKNIRAIYTSD